MFPAAHSFFGVVTHTYLASTSSGLNVVATSRPNIGLKVATLRPMFRFGKVTHTYLASKSPGLNVAWPQRRLASMSPGLNVAWPQCRGLNVAGLNVAWPQCPIVVRIARPSDSAEPLWSRNITVLVLYSVKLSYLVTSATNQQRLASISWWWYLAFDFKSWFWQTWLRPRYFAFDWLDQRLIFRWQLVGESWKVKKYKRGGTSLQGQTKENGWR